MAGNIAGAVLGGIGGMFKGRANSDLSARKVSTGEEGVDISADEADGGENAMTGAVRGYTEGLSDTVGLTGQEKENKNNAFGEGETESSQSKIDNIFQNEDGETKLNYNVSSSQTNTTGV